MRIQIETTDDPRLGKYDVEGHRIQPKQDINSTPFNPESQGYTQFYFTRDEVPYFLQVPISSHPKDGITVEFLSDQVIEPEPEDQDEQPDEEPTE